MGGEWKGGEGREEEGGEESCCAHSSRIFPGARFLVGGAHLARHMPPPPPSSNSLIPSQPIPQILNPELVVVPRGLIPSPGLPEGLLLPLDTMEALSKREPGLGVSER